MQRTNIVYFYLYFNMFIVFCQPVFTESEKNSSRKAQNYSGNRCKPDAL